MDWDSFLQLIAGFLIFTFVVIILNLLELDIGFLVTFILAIFTIGASIFFFVESNKIFGTMQEKLTLILKGVENMRFDPKKVERFKSFKNVVIPRRLYDKQRNRLYS